MSKPVKQAGKEAVAPSGPSGAVKILRWILIGLGALIFAKGELDFFQNRLSAAMSSSVLGVILAAAGYFLPLVPWLRLKEMLLELKANANRVKAPASPREARASLQAKALEGPKLPWTPFSQDRLIIPRHWLALPLFLLAVHADISTSGGHVVMAIGDMALGLVLGWVYLSNFGTDLVFPHLNENFKTLLMLLAPVILFEIPGTWLLHQYVYVMTGYGVVLLGSAWILWILSKRPFNFVDDEVGTSRDERWYPEKPFFNPNTLAVKSSLVTAAAVSAFLAINIFSGRQPGLCVVCGFLGIIFLLLSFPWFPDGIASWPTLPPVLRGSIALGMAALAFFLGIRGQILLDGGQQHAGLWYFLAAGILLILGLGHYGGRSQSGSGDDSGPWAKRLEIVAVLILVVASINFRAHNLNIFPFGAEGDEAGGGVWAVDALNGHVDNPLVSANVPLHFFSVTGIFFKIFGIQVWTLRAHSVFFGVISIIATYFFLRFFFAAAVSLAVTTLMSFSYWHLHYSRFGHYNIEQVALEMVAFYFVFKGMRSGKIWAWILGGFSFGLAMQPHLASRLLPFEGIALLGYFLVARRDLLRRHAGGFIIFVIAAWMAAAPAVTYWLSHAGSMGRVQSVSIFDRTNTNAPTDVLQGFVQNCKISVLMFNQFSDSRSRDNPLAPQKILEFWSAILFALSFIYLLYHWRDSVAFLLLAAFFINLSASIFSVEAPQTLRTAGNIPLVFAFMGFLLYDVRETFRLVNRKFGKVVFLLAMLPSIGFFSYRSWQKYFVEASGQAFDAIPTYVAQVAGQQGTPKDQAVIFATGFATSHPPVILFTQSTPIRNFFTLSDYLPISIAADKTHLLFFCDSFESLSPWAESLYPKAKTGTLPYLNQSGDMASYMIVSKEEIASHQGLEATVDGKTVVEHTPLEYPSQKIPTARSIRWKGSVRLENYGFYTFAAMGTGDCTMRLAGQLAYSRVGAAVHAPVLRLPEGVLPIEVDYKPRGTEPFGIHWTGRPHPAQAMYSFRSVMDGSLEMRQLLDFPIHGIYAQYYTSKDFKGDSVMEWVEPTIFSHWLDPPLLGSWCAVWKGKLLAPVSGAYRFNPVTSGFNEVLVDGKVVARSGVPPVPVMNVTNYFSSPVLSAGEHNLEMRFYTTGSTGYELRWTIPGKLDQPVLPEYLTPTYPRFEDSRAAAKQ